MWQFYVLLVLSAISYVANVFLLAGKLNLHGGKSLSQGEILLGILLASFGMYISYSLYDAHQTTWTLGFLIFQWANSITHNLSRFFTRREVDYGKVTVYWGFFVSTVIAAYALSYGVLFIWGK